MVETKLIRDADLKDVNAIKDIYNYYILETTVTFEENPVTEQDITTRILESQSNQLPWIVLEVDSQVIGYAYGTKWKQRSAYRFSVESSVYLSKNHHGKGHGTALYQALLTKLKQLGINTVVGGITLPNPASIALHEKMGMEKVAHFLKIGNKFEQWLDVGYWQINLNVGGHP